MDEDRASVAGSNPSLISNRPILEAKPPSRRSSRSTSPIRSTVALLRSAAPPIDICQPGPAAAASPGEAVNKLKGFLLDGYDKAFIPRQLEARLRKIAPDEAIVLHEAMFHDHHGYTTEELDSLWEDIQDVCYEANACSNLLKDENAWVQVVRSVLRLGGMHALSKDLELNSVQSQSIESQYLPTLPSSPTSLSKKADLALVISPPRHSDSTINQWRKQNTGVGLSHMSGAYTRETLLACPLEVKRQGGDYNEAVCQLAVWSAAALEKLRILASMGRDKEMLEGFPYPGWTVVGHEWQLHISWKEDSGKVGSESFVGDLSSGALTTPFTIFRSRVELSFTSPGVGRIGFTSLYPSPLGLTCSQAPGTFLSVVLFISNQFSQSAGSLSILAPELLLLTLLLVDILFSGLCSLHFSNSRPEICSLDSSFWLLMDEVFKCLEFVSQRIRMCG